jgi:hypothetical protein
MNEDFSATKDIIINWAKNIPGISNVSFECSYVPHLYQYLALLSFCITRGEEESDLMASHIDIPCEEIDSWGDDDREIFKINLGKHFVSVMIDARRKGRER